MLRFRPLLSSLLLLALPSPARAASFIPAWEFDFSDHPYEEMTGHDGWVSGYGGDPWTSNLYPDYAEVNPLTDEGGGSWGSGQAIDNHLVATTAGPFSDIAYEVSLLVIDDDSAGMVFGWQEPGTFYLFFFTEGIFPRASDGASQNEGRGAHLYKIQDGEGVELAFSNSASLHASGRDELFYNRLRCDVELGTLTCGVNTDEEFGGFEPGNVVLSAEDPDPLPAGRVGVWTFECGDGGYNVGFRYPVVSWVDTDSDGTGNDQDCAPANPAIHPGADEIEDGLDNNCDGVVDNGGGDDDTPPGDDDVTPGDDDDATASDDDTTPPGDDDATSSDDDATSGDDDDATGSDDDATSGDDDDATAGDDDASSPGDDDSLDVDPSFTPGCGCQGGAGTSVVHPLSLLILLLLARRRPSDARWSPAP